MENILKEINAKIKEIVQCEEIDTQKLTELISMRDRLKGYNVTSIAQVQGFNTQPVPAYPILGNMRQHQNNSMFDGLTDIANVILKQQINKHNGTFINDLIYYYKFISDLEMSTETEINDERLEIKNNIEQLIMKEFKNNINERKSKENQQEKDKIIEVQP